VELTLLVGVAVEVAVSEAVPVCARRRDGGLGHMNRQRSSAERSVGQTRAAAAPTCDAVIDADGVLVSDPLAVKEADCEPEERSEGTWGER